MQLGVVSPDSGTFNGGVGGEQAVQQAVWNRGAALERDRQVNGTRNSRGSGHGEVTGAVADRASWQSPIPTLAIDP